MKKAILMVLLLVPGLIFAQNNVQKYIDSKMKTDPNLINSVTGILAMDAKGNVIASWNPDLPLLTASTMKTISTGAGFEVLGPDYKFSTKIAYDGCIDENGVLQGNLYIVGGGDPTLGSRDTIAYDINDVFGEWAEAIRKAGIKKVNGLVIGDDRFFADENVPDSWTFGNVGYDYGSGTTGLNFAENLTYFEVAPGKIEGDPVSIKCLGPDCGTIEYSTYKATTGKPKSGDNTAYYPSCLAPVGEFTGTYAIDRRVDTVAFSNKFGPLTCANQFNIFLKEAGIFTNGYTDAATMTKSFALPSQKDLNYICETFSPELRRIVKVTNTISNNFFAETIFKTVGKTLIEKKTGKDASGIKYYWASKAVDEYFNERGLSTVGYTQDDGSGLSRENYVSPRFFCNFYTMMAKSATFADYLETFPGPGRPGTLKNVLSGKDEYLKSTIRAKSGSLSSVRCYAGYVNSKKGLIKFAILVNNYACPTSTVQPKIEGFMYELAKYGAGQN